MSCHGFSIFPISTVILTYRIALDPYIISLNFFVIVETKQVGPYNIPIIIKDKMNDINFHNKHILLTYKAESLSTVNTIKIYIIPRDFYDTYVSIFYCNHHVKCLNQRYKNC